MYICAVIELKRLSIFSLPLLPRPLWLRPSLTIATLPFDTKLITAHVRTKTDVKFSVKINARILGPHRPAPPALLGLLGR